MGYDENVLDMLYDTLEEAFMDEKEEGIIKNRVIYI